MKEIMDWKRCEKIFIKKIEVDPDKIASLKETAEKRTVFIKKQDVTHQNVSFIVEGYYEVVKELLTALLLQQGLRSRNHQCLISFFYKEYKEYEAEAHLIAHMSYLRNRLNYYGEQIEYEFYEKNRKAFEEVITILKDLLKSTK